MNISDSVLKSEERAILTLRSLYRRFGYSSYKMNKFEEYDLYVRNKSFLVSDDIITFTDRSGKLLAMKPDVTLSIVKNTTDTEGGVRRLCYDESVYRVPKGDHAFREITQVGLECIGDIESLHTAEVLFLAAKSLSLISERFVFSVSHLGILSSVLESAGVTSDARGEFLRALGEKNLDGITELAERYGLSNESTDALRLLVTAHGTPSEVLPRLSALTLSECGASALAELSAMMQTLESRFPANTVFIDFSVTSDMTYYGGIVFKGFINGIASSVLSGGSYDPLMHRMGKKSRAIGFALYLDLLERLPFGDGDTEGETLLLCDSGVSASLLLDTMQSLTEKGCSVRFVTQIPTNTECARVLRLSKDGTVKEVALNA